MRSCLHTSMLLVLVLSGAVGTSADQIDVPRLIEAVETGDKTTRIAALCELGDARHLAREAVPAIARALEDEDEEVRAEAVWALENLGIHAEGAVPALVRTLSNERLCDVATDALASIGRPAVRELIQALDDKSPLVRESAVCALARIGPSADQAVPRLIEVVRSDDKQLQTPAVLALARIGAAAKPALPLLHERLQSKDVQYRVEAAKALWEVNRERPGGSSRTAFKNRPRSQSCRARPGRVPRRRGQ